jgi:uncharacterized membrane protein YfcA
VSFVAGIFASITGGTSLLTVPVMLVAGMSAGDAVATNMLVITSLSLGSVLRFRSAGVTSRNPTVGLVLVSLPGSLLGTHLAVGMNEAALRTVIAVALVGMTIVLALQPKLASRPRASRTRAAGYAAMAVWAVYGGMYSGGYAMVLTQACVFFFGLSLLEAIAIAKVVNLAGSLAATVLFASYRRVQWHVGLAMSATALAGGWLGAHLALRWGPQTLRRLLFVAVAGLRGHGASAENEGLTLRSRVSTTGSPMPTPPRTERLNARTANEGSCFITCESLLIILRG